MSIKTTISDFKDLRKAIEEVTKNKPAQTQYERQAEKMGYIQEAADEKDDVKDSGLKKRKDHAGEEEIKKAYLNLGTEAQGSVEYQRGLIQKELAKMGYKTYSKYAFDSIFKFENNSMSLKEVSIGESAFDDMKDIVKTKGAKKIGGVMVDMFTASVITQAYDKVNDANKKKMEKANVQTLVKLAQKVMGMKEELNLDEGKMSDLLIDIQQGATAKELARDFKIPLATAKNFLKDYYGQKKGSRREDVQEGKYLKYSDLLLKKSRLIDKEGPNSPTVKAINKEIGKEMKKLGIHEENLQEGTWAIPDSYKKLYNLQVAFLQMPSKPTKANAKRMAKNIYSIFGDDSFFDDLLRVELGKEGAETDDLRNLIVKHLEPWGLKFKKGSKYQITHAPQKWLDNMTANPADEDVDETAKRRKSGAIKKSGHGAKKKVVFKTDKQDKLISLRVSKEERLKEEQEHAKQSPFKLKSQQYPRAIAIDTTGYGKRHASISDITEACDSFGMITDQELQIEQIQKQLGKKGFISYNDRDLKDVFEDRETQRMIYALESLTEEQKPIEYTKDQVEDSYIMSEEIEFVKPDGQKTAGPILKVCENTFNVKDKYTGKSFTYKFINEGNKVKTFREIISEGKFSAKLIKQAGGIAFDKRYYMGNMTGAIKAIEKLKKGLSDDPKVKDMLRIANESFNNKFFEALTKEDQEAYVKFFKSALKKFGVNSPAELDDDKKKEFFNYIDKNYKGKDEKQEDTNPTEKQVEKALKIDGRRTNFREKMRKLGYIKGPR